ncbi:helix-hairpin-helix domain-containing protein [Neisseria sp. Dent CA1/247]|uniref:ComEA family DNA-binding protein n=1 Tax=Neisseria sp. Dent CA1/247 TaxID=2912675 RepID=UPI001FD278F7|nr:helix-hairpin-helix domain-containing protein [Neisseria sp. Dent CA1/247]UOO76238.1 helix-hairpin-helix domain-containing protein [Neisseria sp. Dent CA1/247]
MKKYLAGALALLWSAVSLAAVNINTATAEELKALPGIGPSKAAAIVEYRQHNGQFKSVDDLKNVKGIGEGILAKLRDEATVSGGKKPVKAAVPELKEKDKEKR